MEGFDLFARKVQTGTSTAGCSQPGHFQTAVDLLKERRGISWPTPKRRRGVHELHEQLLSSNNVPSTPRSSNNVPAVQLGEAAEAIMRSN